MTAIFKIRRGVPLPDIRHRCEYWPALRPHVARMMPGDMIRVLDDTGGATLAAAAVVRARRDHGFYCVSRRIEGGAGLWRVK